MTRGIVIAGPACLPDKHQQSLDWVKERAGFVDEVDPAKSLTLTHVDFDEATRQAEILCVVVLNNFTVNTCEGHIASDGSGRWATRKFCFAVYDLAFNELNRSRLNFVVDTANEAAIRMHDKLGHRREAFLEDALGEGRHLYLYGLTRKEWKAGRFSRPSPNQE